MGNADEVWKNLVGAVDFVERLGAEFKFEFE
jgi:hypothetical protein